MEEETQGGPAKYPEPPGADRPDRRIHEPSPFFIFDAQSHAIDAP
jgi:hypothetical protein